jgi:acid phosphatase (class A)
MKKLFLITVVLVSATLASANGNCPSTSEGKYSWNYGIWTYLDSTNVASSLEMLDPYPSSGTPAFLLDKYTYFEARLERNSPRGQEAILDARIGGDTILSRFTEAFGWSITKDNLPELYKLLMSMKETAGTLATMHAKRYYHRERPFVYFHDTTLTPEAEASLRKDGSYPSGHACMFYAISLVLQEICPERQVEIMRRGYEGGRSRLIVGAHWYSDIVAGQLLASTIVARLHAHPDFMRQLEKAKNEYQAMKFRAKRNSADVGQHVQRKLPRGVD